MPVGADTRVQLLCRTFCSLRRSRRSCKPFSGPVALTQDRVRSASSAVLSTADSIDTASARPLQEQLRDHIDLHQLQREPVPEEFSGGDAAPTQQARKSQKGNKNSTKREQPLLQRRNPSKPRSKNRSSKQLEQATTTHRNDRRAARPAQAVPESGQQQKAETKQHILTKQEDTALCSAIKVSTHCPAPWPQQSSAQPSIHRILCCSSLCCSSLCCSALCMACCVTHPSALLQQDLQHGRGKLTVRKTSAHVLATPNTKSCLSCAHTLDFAP